MVLGGCGKESTDLINKSNSDTEAGGMTEESISCNIWSVYIIEKREDNSLWALGKEKKDSADCLMESSDCGVSWNLMESLPDELQTSQEKEEGNRELLSAALCENTWYMVMWVRGTTDENGRAEYWKWNPGSHPEQITLPIGESREYMEQSGALTIDINGAPNYLHDILSAKKNQIIGEGISNGEIFLIDLDEQQIVWSIKMKENQRTAIAKHIIGNELYVIRYDGTSDVYSMDTGEYVREDKNLSELMSRITSNGNYTVLIDSDVSKAIIYVLSNNGLYSHSVNQGIDDEILILGSDATFGKTRFDLKEICVNKDGTMNILGYDSSGVFTLLKYSAKSDEKVDMQEELSVYTMYENEEIKQAAITYDDQAVKVKVDIGTESDESQEYSDAVNQLNTQLASGKGPDILVLDGIDPDNYMKKGVLLDISDVISTVDENDGINPIILDQFCNNQTYYIPTHFTFNAIVGDGGIIGDTNGMDTVGILSEVAKENEESGSPREVFEKLYNICYSTFVLNGKLNKKATRNFFEIYGDMMSGGNNMVDTAEGDYSGIAPMQCILRDTAYSFGTIDSFGSLGMIRSVLSEKDGWDYIEISEEKGIILIPKTIIAINKNCKNPKAANKFIRYLLSTACQEKEYENGFPVNETALNKQIEDAKKAESYKITGTLISTGASKTIVVESLREEDEAKVYNIIHSADAKCLTQDYVLKDIFWSSCRALVSGTRDIEKIMEKVKEKTNLYLKETQ